MLGMAETSLCRGLVYFDCFPNFKTSLQDRNILGALTFNIKTTNYKTKNGILPVAFMYKKQYKVISSAFSTRTLKSNKKEKEFFSK